MTIATPEHEQRETFFRALLSEGLPDDLWAYVWTPTPTKHSEWVQTASDAEASTTRNGCHDIYMGVGLAAKKGGPYERLKSEDAVALLALVGDIDFQDRAAHKHADLPPDEAAALSLLDEIEVPPTFAIHSGHGLQAWWLFEEIWRFVDDADQRRAMRLARAWQAHLKAKATAHGWSLDSVGDLARVMRIPGTLNAKNRKQIVATRLVRTTPDARYTPEALLALCANDPETVTARNPSQPDDTAEDISKRRFRKNQPCPICHGYEELPPGIGERCWGFYSEHRDVAFCTREEHAGDLPPITTALGVVVYAHKLVVTRRLVLTPIGSLEAQRISWLFDGYIPAGEVSALAGAGGAGKTSAAMSIAVAKAGGLPLPNGAAADVRVGEPMGVIYMTNENHPNKVLRPRLEAEALRQTGGDILRTKAILERIFVVQGVVTLPNGLALGEELQQVTQRPEAVVLPRDVDALRDSIRANDVGLVIVDPVISFSERDLDVLNPADMRKLLDPLAVLSQEDDIAIWVLVHFSKAIGTSVILRISLSRQLTDTARAVGVVLEDPGATERRWLAWAKGNLGVTPPAYSFALEQVVHPTFPDAVSAVVRWGETRNATADKLEHDLALEAQAAQQAATDPFDTRHARGDRTKEAIKYLGEKIQALRDDGDVCVSADELEQWASDGGFSKETWTKARRHLGVKPTPDGHQGAWTQDLDDFEWLKKIPPHTQDSMSGHPYIPPTPHTPGTPGGTKL